jgi:KDO2-lipid IV(A) lauroyltransferase
MGINVISRIDYPKKILRVLKDNELVGFLSDQDIDSIDGVFVDFFGIKAYTPSAPVKFALSTGAPIIPMLIVRGRNKHTIFVEEPIRVEGEEDKKKATLLYTQRYTKILEDYIRSYPDHWVWLHRRWKTRPAGNDQTVFVGR